MTASFSRLDTGDWGVKIDHPQAGTWAGKTVEVRKRNGEIQSVRLAEVSVIWNGGQSAKYKLPPKGSNGVEPQPLEKRSKKTYKVRVTVLEGDKELKVWEMPVKAQDENLVQETGVEVARTAISFYDLLSKKCKRVAK